MANKTYPNESQEYRRARDELLKAEIELRQKIEDVAARRRKLPLGGKIPEDYTFEEIVDRKVTQTKLSELFREGQNVLVVYGMMFAPKDNEPCPMCNSIVDGLNGQSQHINDRVNFVVISKAPIEKLEEWKKKRDWKNIRILSSLKNTFNNHYLAQNSDDDQLPMLNVFQKNEDGVFHFYGTEMLSAPSENGMDSRHVDIIWPLWNMFDFTPIGRGKNWYPKFTYKE